MGLESRLGFPSKEKAAKATIATLVFTVPIAGFIARREISLRKAEKRRIFEEGNNSSGDFGAIFPVTS